MLFWHVSEPCYAFQRKRTFRISSGERESLCMYARLCAWLRLSVPLVVRSALLSGPHPSQMMTRGGMQLTLTTYVSLTGRALALLFVCLSYALAE